MVLNRRGGGLENTRLLWAVPDSTERDLGSTNPGPRIVLGGLAGGVPTPSPFLGILGDDPGARPGVGRLMPGGPSRGCWNEGRCYGNGRQRPSLSMATGGESFWRIRTGGVSRGPSVPARPISPLRCNTADVTLAVKHNKSQKDRKLNGRIEARLGRTRLSELWRKVQKQVD